MNVYENIKARREFLKWTQKELAEKMGYTSSSTIAKIEAGENDFPQSKIPKFAEVLGITICELLNAPPDVLRTSERETVRAFMSLNDEGQRKVSEYVSDLSEIPKYRK